VKRIFAAVLAGMLLLAGCSGGGKTVLLDVYQPELPEIVLTSQIGLLIDGSGNLYSWGYDDYNAGSEGYGKTSLGQGKEVLYNNIPTEIYSGVAFAESGSRGVTKSGELIEWGKLLEDDSCVPVVVRENVAKMNWILYLTKDHELWTIPAQEDLLQKEAYADSGELVLTDVRDFLSGYTYFALKDDGSVWTFLINGYGEIVERPKKLLDDVVKLYSGNSTTSAALFLKDDETLWSYGGNEYGQCGNGEHGDFDVKTQDCVVTEPYQMAENVTEAWANSDTTYYLTADNSLYACGKNFNDLLMLGENGQMNPYDFPAFTATPVLLMENVRQMQQSGEGFFVLKTDNTLWSWGYADKGILGGGVCYEGDDLSAGNFSDRKKAKEALYSQPTQIMKNVERLFTETAGLYFVQKTDGSIWYWGFGSIYVDKEDDWDKQETAWQNAEGEYISAYLKYYIIPTPVEFSIETFFQNALDSIAAREGIDTAQYQAVKYIDE